MRERLNIASEISSVSVERKAPSRKNTTMYPRHFSFQSVVKIDMQRKRRRAIKTKSSRSITEKKSKKVTKKKKKIGRKIKNHSLGNIESRNATYPIYSLNWDRKKIHWRKMSFLHTHSSECVKSELDLFSLSPT